MSVFTKDQIRSAVRQAIDDPTSSRWSDSNLDILITMVEDTIFQAVLDTFPWFQSTGETVTTGGGGSVNLDTTLTKRWYRVQKVIKVSDSSELQPKLFNESLPQATYFMQGPFLNTSPLIVGANSITVTYAYLPSRFTDLATGATALTDFPEGHEAALVYLSAAWAMSKGDAESIAQVGRIADQAVEALLVHIARRYPISAMSGVPLAKQAIMRNYITPPPS